MLGNILGALTDATSAEEALAAIADPGVVEGVQRGAAVEGVGVGAFVASTVRQMLDYAGKDVWLDLLGHMSGSARPGVAALETMLSRSFPAPPGAGAKRIIAALATVCLVLPDHLGVTARCARRVSAQPG